MYMPPAVARDRYLGQLEQARRARMAYQATQLRKVQRIQQRAERRLLRAWERADELRTMIETTG
jgi:hypothetical protein